LGILLWQLLFKSLDTWRSGTRCSCSNSSAHCSDSDWRARRTSHCPNSRYASPNATIRFYPFL